MKPILKLLVLAAAFAVSVGVHAQSTPTAPAAMSPAKKELINKLIKLQQGGIENIARALIQQPLGSLMQSAGMALRQEVPADKREALAKTIETDIRKFADENVAIVKERGIALSTETWTPILDHGYSEDELKQVIAWLESPVSLKFQQVSGELQNALGQKLVAETRATMEPRFKALEQSVAKTLGLPPPKAAPPTAAKPVKPSASAAKK